MMERGESPPYPGEETDGVIHITWEEEGWEVKGCGFLSHGFRESLRPSNLQQWRTCVKSWEEQRAYEAFMCGWESEAWLALKTLRC